jgi:hypothetical protein
MSSRSPIMRRLTRWVLLVWLLAFGVGVVNACVLPSSVHGPASAQAGGDAETRAPVPCHDEVVGDEIVPDGRPATSACAKLCADETLRVPVLEHAFDAGAGLALAPLPTLGLALAGPAPLAPQALADAPTPRPGVPVAIAFLRLTL